MSTYFFCIKDKIRAKTKIVDKIRKDDSMSRYKVDIARVDTNNLKTLKNDEIKCLLKEYQLTHNELLKETLIMGNLKLVLSMVARFSHRSDNLDDLFQIGVIGLIKAIDHFNLDLDVQFSTYAVPLIIGEMKRYLREYSPIKISRTIRDHTYKIMNMKEEWLKTHHDEPTLEQIQKITGLSLLEVNTALNSMQCVQSLFEPSKNMDSDSINLIDQVDDKRQDMNTILDQIALKDALKKLTKKEKWLIEERYFLDKTQLEVAESLHVSQAQVSRLEKNVIYRLKELMS